MLIHLEPSNFICFPVSFATMSEAMTIPMTSDQILLKLRETLKWNKLCWAEPLPELTFKTVKSENYIRSVKLMFAMGRVGGWVGVNYLGNDTTSKSGVVKIVCQPPSTLFLKKMK